MIHSIGEQCPEKEVCPKAVNPNGVKPDGMMVYLFNSGHSLTSVLLYFVEM